MPELPPTSPALELAALFEQLGVGAASLADVLRLEPSALAQLVDKALALAEVGRAQDAEALLAQLAEVDSASAMLPYLLAAVRAEAGRDSAAAEACQEALRRDGGGVDTAVFRAEVLLLLGRVQLALHDERAARWALEGATLLEAPARGPAQVLLRTLEGGDAPPR